MQAQTDVVYSMISLETATGEAAVHTSCPMPVMGNALVLQAYCMNVTGAATFSAIIQGSNDNGLSWTDQGAGFNLNALGKQSYSVTSVTFGHYRVKLDLSGTTQVWLGRVYVTQSRQ